MWSIKQLLLHTKEGLSHQHRNLVQYKLLFMMDESNFIRKAAALFGFTGVALGAFGAHMLKGTLARNNTTDSWKTAVSYQLIHALALLAVSTREVDVKSSVPWSSIANSWIAGTVLFSGSIYGLCLGGSKLLGPVTPVGGVCLMAGWGLLLMGLDSNKK